MWPSCEEDLFEHGDTPRRTDGMPWREERLGEKLVDGSDDALRV